MDTTQLLKAFEAVALLLAGAVFVVWQLRSTERDLQRSRAERLAREARETREAREAQEARNAIDAIDASGAGDRPSEPRP